MLFGLTPDFVNERLKRVDGYKDGNLIIWKKIEEALPGVKFVWRYYAYDNAVAKENIPCMVEVSGAAIGGDRHWVLFVGNQKMYDPWDGKEKSTLAYGMPLGFVVLEGAYMPEPEQSSECLVPNTPEWRQKYEELVDKATKYDALVAKGYGSVDLIEEKMGEKANEARNDGMKKGVITADQLSEILDGLSGIARASQLVMEAVEHLQAVLIAKPEERGEAKAAKVKKTSTENSGMQWLMNLVGVFSQKKGVKNA
jgi:hypothetical protein